MQGTEAKGRARAVYFSGTMNFTQVLCDVGSPQMAWPFQPWTFLMMSSPRSQGVLTGWGLWSR